MDRPAPAAPTPTPARRRVSPYLLLTLTPLFWSINWVLGRGLHHEIPPMAMTFFRWFFAIVILAPFAVSHVQYGLARKPIADCVNTYAHRVEIFVTEGGKPPPKPSTDASTFVSIAVEESFEDIDLRVLEPKLDPPIVLTDGQSLVVAVSLEADVDANLSLCLASCVGAAIPGVDYWSYAAAEPYKWVDLVANYNWPANFKIYAFGTAL